MGVLFELVDLRWGITDEEARTDELLDICLSEAEACTILVCLIGSRYGWVPPQRSAVVRAGRPWLTEGRDWSISELEVRAAVRRPTGAPEGLIFVRSNIEERDPRVDRLVDFARESFPNGVHQFASAADLVLQATDRLLELVGRATGTPPFSGVARRQRRQQTLERHLAEVIVGREDDLARLRAAVAESTEPIAVTGAPGVGKTAVLAALVQEHRNSPGRPVVASFVDAQRGAGELDRLLTQLDVELAALPLISPLPDVDEDQVAPRASTEVLAERLTRRLDAAERCGGVLLVIDGAQHLSGGKDELLPLWWLPQSVGPNVQLVISTSPGPSQDETVRRGWRTVDIAALSATAREEFIERSLMRVGKRLPDELRTKLARHPVSADAFYLQLALDELMMHGDHALIDSAVSAVMVESTSLLVRVVLTDAATTYDGDLPGTVAAVILLLYVAHDGVAVEDLSVLVGGRKANDTAEIIARLRYALPRIVTEVDGRIWLANERVRAAIEAQVNAEQIVGARRRLAEYASGFPTSDERWDEFPRQLAELGDGVALESVLSDRRAAGDLWKRNPLLLRASFLCLLDLCGPSSPRRALRSAVTHGVDDDVPEYVTHLLQWLGDHAEAETIFDLQIARAEATGDSRSLEIALVAKAGRLKAEGDLVAALRHYERARRFAEARSDTQDMAICDNGLVQIHRRLGHLDQAWRLVARQLELSERSGSTFLRAAAHMNAAGVAERRASHDSVEESWRLVEFHLRAAETLYAADHRPEGVANARFGRAKLAFLRTGSAAKGDPASCRLVVSSFREMGEAVEIARRTLSESLTNTMRSQCDELQPLLVNAGWSWIRSAAGLIDAGQHDRAVALIEVCAEAAKVADDRPLAAGAEGERGVEAMASGRWSEAVQHLQTALRIQAELELDERSATLLSLSEAYRHVGDLRSARRVAADAEAVYSALGNMEKELTAIDQQALLSFDLGDVDAGFHALRHGADVARWHGCWQDEVGFLLAGFEWNLIHGRAVDATACSDRAKRVARRHATRQERRDLKRRLKMIPLGGDHTSDSRG
jgi:tetratricopeptide (TPR) repeat protein